MPRLLFIFGFLFLCSFISNEPKTTPLQYIEKYKHLAVLEMHRTGIPASITMAQGLLESGNGNSRLATKGNNHFGIKCKKSWKGNTIFEDDDEEHECFRAYDSAYLSYIDHSEFLMSNQRYSFLFEYKNTDYKNWAYGLKKAGYATNPAYPKLLIRLIERHELNKLDRMSLDEIREKPKGPEPKKEKPKTEEKNEGGQLIFNDIDAVRAQPGDNIVKLAKRNDMGAWQIRRYNDLPRDYELTPGEILYLKPKKRKGSAPYHVVQPGETMWSISQMYGIKLKHLYRKNRLSRRRAEQPFPGEKLNLRRKSDEAPKTQDESTSPSESPKKVILPSNTTSPKEHVKAPKPGEKEANKKPQVEKKPKPVLSSKPILTPQEVKDTSDIPRQKINPAKKAEIHKVVKNESLFDIALQHKMHLEDLMELNGKTNFQVKPDEELIINPNKVKQGDLDLNAKTYFHEVTKGQTLYSISREYNIPVGKLIELNDLEEQTIQIGQKIILFRGTKKETQSIDAELKHHKVEKGDTLYSISRKYGIPVDRLKEINQLTDNAIRVGQLLQLE